MMKIRTLLSCVTLFLLFSSDVWAGCPRAGLSTSGITSPTRCPSARFRYMRAHYLIKPNELLANGIINATLIDGIGWNYTIAPSVLGQGNLKVYLQNSTDITNHKSTSWATSIADMTIVHNGAVTLPQATGPFYIDFAGSFAPFAYTGKSLYVAFEWEMDALNPLSAALNISCEGTAVNSFKGNANSVGFSDALVASTPRPETYFKCFLPNLVTVDGTQWKADFEKTDQYGWTHYYDDNGTVGNFCDDHLLLSLYKNGNTIGTIGDGTFVLSLNGGGGTCHVNPDNTPPINYVSGTNWWTMGRYWDVVPTTQPTSDVYVRFYYQTKDYVALCSNIPLTSHSNLTFYKINNPATGTYDLNPANGHQNIPPATAYNGQGFWQYPYGTTSSVDNWTYTGLSADEHCAEMIIAKFSGGGGGAGSVNNTTFPIELLSFTGKSQGTENFLTWITTSETNNAGFQVQRSSDAEMFEDLEFVVGNGTTKAQQRYDFRDRYPLPSLNYYRLKQIDINGNFTYSNILRMKDELVKTITTHPNPSKGVYYIVGKEIPHLETTLSNYLGQEMKVIIENNALDITTLPSGIYYLHVANQYDMQPLIKQ